MNTYSLLVLSAYHDIFHQFYSSWKKYECDVASHPVYPKILVRDGNKAPFALGWNMIKGPEPYIMPINENLGLHAAGWNDVIFISDDVQFTDSGQLDKLQEVAYSDPEIGMVMPQLQGGTCCPPQHHDHKLDTSPQEVDFAPFIAYYLKREVIDRVGLLDERFVDYGWDDKDYCLRVRMAGYRIVLTDKVVFKHGFHAPECNTYSRKGMDRSLKGSNEVFANKWAHARKVLG